jgi:hypothetical protein
MSFYEIIMLGCFGCAWPFSIYKSYTSWQNAGKSSVFLWMVLIGYAAGVMHKLIYNFDGVIYLYMFNGIMVLIDLALYYRNLYFSKKAAH